MTAAAGAAARAVVFSVLSTTPETASPRRCQTPAQPSFYTTTQAACHACPACQNAPATCLAIDPKGRFVAVGDDQYVKARPQRARRPAFSMPRAHSYAACVHMQLCANEPGTAFTVWVGKLARWTVFAAVMPAPHARSSACTPCL
jgi:hypothetical protein